MLLMGLSRSTLAGRPRKGRRPGCTPELCPGPPLGRRWAAGGRRWAAAGGPPLLGPPARSRQNKSHFISFRVGWE